MAIITTNHHHHLLSSPPMRFIALAVVTALLIVLDLATKSLAAAHLTTTLGWLPYAGLALAHNPAIAFGIPIPQPAIILMSFAAIIFFVHLFVRQTCTDSFFAVFAFGLLLGGAFGNLIERLFFGTVTDFLVLLGIPNFNLADTFLTFAVILLVFFHERIFLPTSRV